MKKKNITIDDLARMVKVGFDGVDKRFDGVEERLVRIEKKLEGVVYRREFEQLEARVVDLENLLAVNAKKH
jgi:hypothetical protein